MTSCSIIQPSKTSIFHSEKHILLPNGTLKSLNPNLPIATLQQILKFGDKHPRQITSQDLIQDILFPVYFQSKVAFQCLQPTSIFIDNVDTICSSNVLQFIERPNTVTSQGKLLWKNHATRNITRLQLCIKLENTELRNKIYSYNIIQHHTTP